jgi:hypothetical protein
VDRRSARIISASTTSLTPHRHVCKTGQEKVARRPSDTDNTARTGATKTRLTFATEHGEEAIIVARFPSDTAVVV